MDSVVVLVDLPDERVRAVRARVPPAALPAFARAHLDGAHGTPYLVLHAPATEGEDGDVEAVSPHPDGALRAGARCAATTVRGDAARRRDVLAAAHEAVAAQATAQGLSLAGPPRERYLPDGAVQVAWPVEEPVTGG